MSALLTGRTLKKQKARRKEHSHWKSEKQLHHGGGGAAAEGHTLRAKGKLAATSRDWKTVLTNSHSKAHGCQGSGSTLGLSRKQLAHELREGSGALRDETHPADSNFLQTETRGRQMSIDVHPSLRRCLEKKSNSQDHRNEKTRSRRYEKL